MRIATFNIYRHLVDRRRLEDLRDLLATPGLDVAGLQEIVWELDGHLPEGWDFWQPDDPAARKDPLVWRRDLWVRLDAGSRLVGERVEDDRGTAPARYVNWVVLEHLPTDLVVAIANIHPNAGVEENGRPKQPLLRTREHTDTVTGAIAVLDEISATWECPSILVGDFNVDYGDDKSVRDPRFPYSLLTSAGFECVWELGEQSTRSGIPVVGRTIDQVWARGTPDVDVTFTAVRTPTHWGSWAKGDVESDHLPVLADLDLRVAARPPASVVTREQWGSTGQRPTSSTHPIGSTRGITAHALGPGVGGLDHALCARKVRALERFHEARRLAGIAYNAVVCPHGYVFEGRGPGVMSAANGYGSPDDDWYAVCYVGGAGDEFTEEGRQGFLAAFAWLTSAGDAGPERNGHRDLSPTACPGDDIYAWVHSLGRSSAAVGPEAGAR